MSESKTHNVLDLSPDIRSIVAEYLAHMRAQGKAENTLAASRSDLNILLQTIDKEELAFLDENRLVSIINLASGCAISSPKRSTATINRFKSTLRSFLKWGAQAGRIRCDMSDKIALGRYAARKTLGILPEELRTLLDTIMASDDPLKHRDYALFSAYATTGLRRSAVLGLRLHDYDPVGQNIFAQEKGGKGRWLPISSSLVMAMEGYFAVRSEERHLQLRKSHLLFPGQDYRTPLSPRQANERFTKWRTMAGIRKQVTLHSFRVGFATRLYQRCGDIHIVAACLGHSDLNTTKRYIDLDPGILRERMGGRRAI